MKRVSILYLSDGAVTCATSLTDCADDNLLTLPAVNSYLLAQLEHIINPSHFYLSFPMGTGINFRQTIYY